MTKKEEPSIEIICRACNGTGRMPVVQPRHPMRRIYPPTCTKCNGKGSVLKSLG